MGGSSNLLTRKSSDDSLVSETSSTTMAMAACSSTGGTQSAGVAPKNNPLRHSWPSQKTLKDALLSRPSGETLAASPAVSPDGSPRAISHQTSQVRFDSAVLRFDSVAEADRTLEDRTDAGELHADEAVAKVMQIWSLKERSSSQSSMSPSSPHKHSGLLDSLERLATLKEKDCLSDSEFQAAKARLLNL